ncbi:adenosylmethionine--8-amino-7-oxononanoate transaminase [Telmatospirillum sp. J64-1]|uniref:adenosylmethionine--8-amino-7-oxononanoate transaminase n=1 Tax=Telmatospirillum sp. J64-1 TaxID=2502183 RepID=UPI00115DFE2E|nr:adenosylmethionine--8-amino-7-oxononanoate transaminase [Telmatospirillum sp. J64-1]
MTTDLSAQDRRHVWHPFTQAGTAPPPIVIERAEGARLHAADGRVFLDLVSSWWVNLHGHAHPAIAEAIAAQARKLEQVIFADFTHEPAVRLATRLAEELPGALNKVFYSDNGSTAVEVALKMALQYWDNKGQGQRTRYIAFEGGYHGDTVGAMSAGASSGYFRAWERLLFPVHFAPFPATWDGDEEAAAKEQAALDAVKAILRAHPGEFAGFIIEPLVQGASGMRICRPGFLRALAELAREEGALLIFDEVMTGFGRTGPTFACQRAGVEPDLICLSKGISGGFLPLSVTVASDEIHDAFLGRDLDRAFLHGHSYTANPLGCAAGLASLDLTLSESCRRRRQEIEDLHRGRIKGLAGHGRASRLRVMGTIAALDVTGGESGYAAAVGPKLKAFFHERGLLLRPLGNVVYLLPPYCVSDDDLHRAWDVIGQALDDL